MSVSRPSGAAGVRAAAPSDLHAVVAFLPWIATADLPLENLVVAECDAGLCGAGALSALPAGPRTLAIDIFVHPDWRRRGLGEALLQRLSGEARGWDAVRLRSRRPTDDPAADAFARHAGAHSLEPLVTYEADLDPAMFARRLGRRAPVAGTGARPLAPGDLPRIAAYYASHLGTSPEQALRRLLAVLADPELGPISLALERAGRLLGFVIFGRDADGVLRLDYWFVDAQARGTSALALLWAAAARATGGRRRLRFQSGVQAATTRRLGHDLGATVLRREVLHELDL